MKVTVKTLKGNHFDLEVEGSESVLSVKQKIEEKQGKDFPASTQLLIYQGKVLADDKTLAENNVTENGFLVVMTTKAKQTAAPSAAVPSTDATTSGAQATATPAAPSPAPATAIPSSEPAVGAPVPPATSAPPPAAAAATDAPAVGSVYGAAASNLVAGAALESTIKEMVDMGGGTWTRDDVRRALTAAYNNPERAIDYLYSGIPEAAEPAQPVARPAAAVPPAVPSAAPAAPAGALPGALGAAPQGPNAAPLDLFPQGMGLPGGGGAAAGAGSLDFLRTNPQFQALRTMVRERPQILQPMLQELGKQNPGLLSLINSNQEDFFRLIHEQGAEGEGDLFGALGGPQPMAINVTQEENEAIQRLEALGFDRAAVIEAFFACDKDEQVAANYLLEHAADED